MAPDQEPPGTCRLWPLAEAHRAESGMSRVATVGGVADRDSFQDDVAGLVPQLYGMGLRLARNRADAEDLVQETLLRAFRGYHTFQEGTNLRAWMFRILTNTFINEYRRRSRRPMETEFDEGGELTAYRSNAYEQVRSWARAPEDQIIEQIFESDIVDAIEDLPVIYRIPVLLADVEGLSYKEIAQTLDLPMGTVMSRLHRGRNTLRKVLWEYASKRGLTPAEVPHV